MNFGNRPRGALTGYLIYRSAFLPRALGIVCLAASAGWLRFFYSPLRFPPFMIIALVAILVEAVKIYWLAVRGVDETKWKERYRLSMQGQ